MKRLALLLGVSLPLAGCITPTILAPGAENVRITKIPADVAACVVKGEVKTPGEFSDKVDREHQLKNATFVLGANTLLDTSKNTTGLQVMNALFLPPGAATQQNEKLRATSGIAYDCPPVDKPAQEKP